MRSSTCRQRWSCYLSVFWYYGCYVTILYLTMWTTVMSSHISQEDAVSRACNVCIVQVHSKSKKNHVINIDTQMKHITEFNLRCTCWRHGRFELRQSIHIESLPHLFSYVFVNMYWVKTIEDDELICCVIWIDLCFPEVYAHFLSKCQIMIIYNI